MRGRAITRMGLGVWALLAAVLALASPVAAQARLEVRVFAHVPPPGYPANAVLAPDGTVYAGTFKSFSDPSDTGPSKVFAFSPSGALLRTYTVLGQTPGTADAVQVGTIDRAGTLYLLDQSPARIVKLDPQTGTQTTWATFKTLPACSSGGPAGACSAGTGGNPPEPDFAAWGPDGSLYVTDYNQDVIWRVPPGGGAASVWLTESQFNGVIVGPAGIELLPDGHTLMLSTGGGGTDVSTGKIYTIPIEANGSPGPRHQLWESAPAEAPDGFAVARSGDIYVALVGPSGNAVDEISPQGQQIARVPANAAANSVLTVPFDSPGSVTFDGDNVLVGNQSAIENTQAHMALLEIAVGEPGAPLSLPPAAAPAPAYRLVVHPSHVVAARRTSFVFSTTRILAGHSQPAVGASVRFGNLVRRTNRHGRATFRLRLHRHIRPYRALLIVGGKRVADAFVRTTR